MPKKVTRWQCEHCHKVSTSRGTITKHERFCYKNSGRQIRTGELALWRTIPRDLTHEDSYGVPMSDWTEPNWDDTEHPWWPRDKQGLKLGCVYDGEQWIDIPGYIYPHFAPGACWRDEHVPGYLARFSTEGLCRSLETVQKFIKELKGESAGSCDKCREEMSWELMAWSDFKFAVDSDEYYFEQICVNEKCEGKDDQKTMFDM